MIDILVRRGGGGMELSACGHADYAMCGEDIVCAAVSALLFGFLSHLLARAPSAAVSGGEGDEAVSDDTTGECRVEYRTEAGILWVRTHGMQGADTLAWDVTRAGLSLVAEEYPACIRLVETP